MSPKRASSHTVRVALGVKRSYDVKIGSEIISSLPKLIKSETKRAVIIADERLADQRTKVLSALTKAGWTTHEIPVQAGESLKNLESLFPIYGEMLNNKIDRSSTLIAVGGGTIGDAAGFVASTYLRGIPWVGVPTTLLGQVDSSVGGKTAVNHPQGKNLIGTFHQPSLVVCDTSFLKTLNQREVISGLAEVIKYGLTFDRKFFDFLKENWSDAVKLEPKTINHLVKVSIAWKAKAVAKDEHDRTGVREVLNFGHTFGHAIEAVTNYQGFQHGEAVLWGMRFALAVSKVRRKLSAKAWEEADSFLRQIPVPELPSVSPEEFFKPMTKDKKAKAGKVRFVLLNKIGKSVLDRDVKDTELHQALKLIKESQK